MAVAKRDGLAFGQPLGKPMHHPVQGWVVVVAAAELRPLLRPAIELAGEIVSGLAEVPQPERLIIEFVNVGRRGAPRPKQPRAPAAPEARRPGVAEHTPLPPCPH